MTKHTEPQTDGGLLEADDPDEEFSLEAELPDDSIFTLDDYLNMYQVASKRPGNDILIALSHDGPMSRNELSEWLDREGNSLHYHLRKLQKAALIRNRRDPNTGTEETYSYYSLTELGHMVLTEGIKDGVKKLASQEADISEAFAEEN